MRAGFIGTPAKTAHVADNLGTISLERAIRALTNRWSSDSEAPALCRLRRHYEH